MLNRLLRVMFFVGTSIALTGCVSTHQGAIGGRSGALASVDAVIVVRGIT